MIVVWIVVAFLAGSLPFSVWIGRLAMGRDIRQFGDANPGATNVLRAGGRAWFLLALLLDISKAILPVGLAYQVAEWRGWPMVVIAIAPPLGHALSPFLGWRGGKAVAAVFGAWIGLTLWRVPLLGAVVLAVLFILLRKSGWVVILTALIVLVYLLFFMADPLLLAVWVGHFAILVWKHWSELGNGSRI